MLNYNYNLVDTIRRKSYFLTGSFDWSFVERTVTYANPNGIGMAYATMSIYWNPFNPNLLMISGSGETGSLQGGQQLGLPILAGLTGSGVWPTTGSNLLSMYITNNQGAVSAASLNLSAVAGNMNLSGSKISASFTPYDNKKVNIFGQVVHTKGNIYNPNVVLSLNNTSPVSKTTPVNNTQSASFNMFKDVNIPLYNYQNVTGSNTKNFAYQFNFGVTSSLTSSIANSATGSTTMSISIPEAGISTSSYYYNATSAGRKIITSSFVATTDNEYNVIATIEYNKGNLATSSINWLVSQSSETNGLKGNSTNLNGNQTAFSIEKNANAFEVYIDNTDGIDSGSYNNLYSFNQTASLLSLINNNSTGSVTMSISIPEAGLYTASKFFNANTTTASISASFEAQSNVVDYHITASIINNKGNINNGPINWLASGSTPNSYSLATAYSNLQIVKDANVELVSYNLTSSKSGSFTNNYAFNITASVSTFGTAPKYRALSYQTSSLKIPEVGIDRITWSSQSLITGSFTTTTEEPYTITASSTVNLIPLFPLTITAIAGGGGGGTGGLGVGGGTNWSGGGGGAGGVFSTTVNIVPNVSYSIVSIGAGGAGAVGGNYNTPNTGATGGNTQINYWIGNAWVGTATGSSARAFGGFGGAGNTGGKSGKIESNEYEFFSNQLPISSQGIAGAGTISGSGLYLGGGGGSNEQSSYQPATSGSIAPTLTNGGYTFTWTGSGGFGGPTDKTGSNATALGAGGGGGGDINYPTTPAGTFNNGGSGSMGGVILSYSGSAKLTVPVGTITTTSNGVTTHIIKTTGSFSYNVTASQQPAFESFPFVTDTLVIGGGGRGGVDIGGGGGAGGYAFYPYYFYNPTHTYSISVGSGSISFFASGSNRTSGSGSNSYIRDLTTGNDIIIAYGGGNSNAPYSEWSTGGSGGGASEFNSGGGFSKPSFVYNYYTTGSIGAGCNAGGSSGGFSTQIGGGGGASAAGGGDGVGGIGNYDLLFTASGVAGGGNAWNQDNNPASCAFGAGSGSNGGVAQSGKKNTGAGGGGVYGYTSGSQNSGAGGSGLVQIRYAGYPLATGGQIENGYISGSIYTVHTFTASGLFTPIA
jgi:hypothetical protein